MRGWSGLILRQVFLGGLSVAATLPLLFWVRERAGLQAAPWTGAILLAGVVLLGWLSGGFIGAALGEASRKSRFRAVGLVAGLLGLMWGTVLTIGVAPFYAQSVAQELTREGAGEVWKERGALLDRTREVGQGKGREAVGQTWQGAKSIAGKLARSGAARLPLAVFAVPLLLGPALAAILEARIAARC